MSKIINLPPSLTHKKTLLALSTAGLLGMALPLIQDFLRATLNQTGYYFSESFLFSTFWWLFVPFVWLQFGLAARICTRFLPAHAAVVILAVLAHLLTFPLLVWALSEILFDHTYFFPQALRYTASEHFYLLVIFYTLSGLVYYFRKQTVQPDTKTTAVKPEVAAAQYIETIVVTEGIKKYSIPVAAIVYLSANPPYFNIHLAEKKYLQTGTLKAIVAQLNPEQFVRVHKSLIVNMAMVSSYTSRLNGDYDLEMKNKVKLRVSRNYAPAFKKRFQEGHHLSLK